MPIISQSALTRLMSAVNEGDSELLRKLQESTDEFGDELSKIWESKKAHEFAQRVEDTVKELHENYKKYIQSIYNTLETNVKNHNAFNEAQVALPGLVMGAAAISIGAKVKEMFADGLGDEMGIRKGRKATEVTPVFDKLVSGITAAAEAAASKITSSGAFDEEEVNAVANGFKKVFEQTKEMFDQLKNEANTALGTVDADAAKLSQTNISNIGN